MYKLNSANNLCETIYEMADEPILSTLFTTGNGYMGVRGSFEEFGSLRIQGAFVRGFIDEITEVIEPFCDNEYMKKYYIDETKLKSFEKQETCVNLPDFTLVRVTVGDKTFYPWQGKILEWNRQLDSRSALYTRSVVWDDGDGNITKFVFERFASFYCQNLYCQRVTITPVNHSLPVTILSGVDTLVKTGGQHITKVDEALSNQSETRLKFHAINKFKFSGEYTVNNIFPAGELSAYDNNQVYGVSCACQKSSVYVLQKQIFVTCCRDENVGEPTKSDYQTNLDRHILAYKQYFDTMDISISGDDEADGYLRLASYHTAISAARHDSVHSVAAKGLTGERYNQFVWWDCEIYQSPFFVFSAPQSAKYQLMYRYRMLAQAKLNAAQNGYKGAMFAFCSSVTGEERVWTYARHPFMQVHINSDIAYAVFNYYYSTGDKQFMQNYGLEIVLECLRFWASRVTLKDDCYQILQVTGTDEHHPYVDNDAYTNYCVKYIFDQFLASLSDFDCVLEPDELNKFKDIQSRIFLPLQGELIPQFDGYFKLSRTLEESGNGTAKQFQMKSSGLYHKSQIIKQPDVILLYSYTDIPMNQQIYSQNWDYYEAMCESSSSLSFPSHAISALQNKRPLSFLNYFYKTVKIDVDDLHKVAWQGVHSGCLAGGYISIIRGVFGVKMLKDALVVSPMLVQFWSGVKAKFIYKNSVIEACMQNGLATFTLLSGSAVNVCYQNNSLALSADSPIVIKL